MTVGQVVLRQIIGGVICATTEIALIIAIKKESEYEIFNDNNAGVIWKNGISA